eukprot:TRINITY_DN2311_c0_g1_i1.p1 TRINITY_DN2311_c0_g1~~TRINITY_DN2311_c0_g1_i1.p1  ORF type:complete len:118 (+),score=21.92 TRINITY_DN2311_c0_g1_i1:195-548(+)
MELGLVAGVSVQAKSFFHDLWSRLRGFFGGEVTTYGDLVSMSSHTAAERLIAEAKRRGAHGVVAVRFQNSITSDPTAGVYSYSIAYGTAVLLDSPSTEQDETSSQKSLETQHNEKIE